MRFSPLLPARRSLPFSKPKPAEQYTSVKAVTQFTEMSFVRLALWRWSGLEKYAHTRSSSLQGTKAGFN
jgi:hypothetical protein